MRKSLLVVSIATMLCIGSCTDETVNIPAPPPSAASIIAPLANAPLALVSYAATAAAAKPAIPYNFYARISDGYIYGNDGCSDFAHSYQVTGDSIRITFLSTMNSCGTPPYPNFSFLVGTWRVTSAAGRIILAKQGQRFEFDTEFGAPTSALPLVGRWILAASDDTLFAHLREANAYPTLDVAPNRWLSLRWLPRCGTGALDDDLFNTAFGVNLDSGIVMKYWLHEGCEYGTSSADAAVWSFAASFFKSSIYAVTDSGAVFRNTQRHTYYRYTHAP
jgi:hypothetical protein